MYQAQGPRVLLPPDVPLPGSQNADGVPLGIQPPGVLPTPPPPGVLPAPPPSLPPVPPNYVAVPTHALPPYVLPADGQVHPAYAGAAPPPVYVSPQGLPHHVMPPPGAVPALLPHSPQPQYISHYAPAHSVVAYGPPPPNQPSSASSPYISAWGAMDDASRYKDGKEKTSNLHWSRPKLLNANSHKARRTVAK